jgi:cytochrome P450
MTITMNTDLPTLAFEQAHSAHEAHELIAEARQRGPIALGPHGPEILSYELVRSVLRDDRFAMPKGLALAMQGITSGELWDIAVKGLLSLDGAAHRRQRKLVSKAFTPRAAERLRSTCTEVIDDLIDKIGDRCDVVADIARQYPIPIICALLGIPAEDWPLFSAWADDVFKIFDWNVVEDGPDIVRAWRALEGYLDDMVTRRRGALGDDLLSDMMRAEVDGDRLAHDELLTLAATHRHHPQSVGRGGRGVRRPPRPVGAAGRPTRIGAQGRRRGHAVHADAVHHHAPGGQRRRTRRRGNPGGHPRHRQHRGGQP